MTVANTAQSKVTPTAKSRCQSTKGDTTSLYPLMNLPPPKQNNSENIFKKGLNKTKSANIGPRPKPEKKNI